jgi:hypothetical protein
MATDGKKDGYVEHDAYGHGHSIAAWTAVSIVLLGVFVMSAAVVLTTLWLFIAGGVITAAGAVTGKVLAAAGLGAKAPSVN